MHGRPKSRRMGKLISLAEDRDSWKIRVRRIKNSMTKIAPRKTQSTRTRVKRISPLKQKKREELRRKHFANVKQTLNKKLRQTDIRTFFKPKEMTSAAGAFAAAARRNTKVHIKYTFVPKKKKTHKKGLDKCKKKKKRAKRKTNNEVRDKYYNKLNGERTFLGCKIATEPDETHDNTAISTNTTIHSNTVSSNSDTDTSSNEPDTHSDPDTHSKHTHTHNHTHTQTQTTATQTQTHITTQTQSATTAAILTHTITALTQTRTTTLTHTQQSIKHQQNKYGPIKT